MKILQLKNGKKTENEKKYRGCIIFIYIFISTLYEYAFLKSKFENFDKNKRFIDLVR